MQYLEHVTLLETSRETDRDAWVKSRHLLVGSSEIATVMQVSRFQTPLELWAKRTGKIDQWKPSRAARYGNKVEAKILELFAEDHPELRITPNSDTFVSKRFPHCAATPDSFAVKLLPYDNDLAELNSDAPIVAYQHAHGAMGIAEVKHASFGWDEWGSDKAPTDAHIQTVWQMGVLGLPWAYITAVVAGRANEPIEPHFEFDDTARLIFEQCIERAYAFVQCVKKDIPPGAGPGDLKLVQQIIGGGAKTVMLPKYFCMGLDLLEKSERKVEAINELLRKEEHVRDSVLAKLLLQANGAKLGILPDGRRVRFTQVERSGYTVKPKKYWKAKVIKEKVKRDPY